MSASTPHAAPNKSSRILSCVLCQHRKIKCDRNSPCANCIKANVTCVPSTPAPTRKRRRPNHDLQERLARCEELLKLYADGSVPGPSPTPAASAASAATPVETTAPSVSEAFVVDGAESACPTADKPANFKPACRMVNDDGSVRFMDSHIWATIYEELQAMRDIVEKEDPEDTSILGSEDLALENNTDLLYAGHVSTANIQDLVPEPIHAFKLWQLFLNRVNPLLKVIHVPTVQPMVLEGAINIMSLPHDQQALLFSIYSAATLSMSESETIQVLGLSREVAAQKFLTGTKMALVRFNFLKNYNMTAFQALLHFMHSLQGRYDVHATWVLMGSVMRIAQKMGYHRDGEVLGLDMYETEMRRRLWWHIIHLDGRHAMLSGLSQPPPPLHWDTKMPSNVNDADIFPGSTAKVRARDGPTEMAFILILNELYKFKMRSEVRFSSSVFEAALLGHDMGPDEEASHAVVQHFRDHFRGLKARIVEMEDKYIDVNAGNVHKAAKSLRPICLVGLADLMVPLRQHPEYGTEIFGPKDVLFKILVVSSETRLGQYESMSEYGFLWFVKSHFQFDVFAVMTGQLCRRLTGSLAERAWAIVERVYHYHDELFDMASKQHAVQAQITLKAWKARQQYFMHNGQLLETPRYIHRLRELLPSADSRSSTFHHSATSTPPAAFPQSTAASSSCSTQSEMQPHNFGQPQNTTTQLRPQGVGSTDPLLGDLFDMTTMNWDLLGDVNPQEQLSLGMFHYGGFPAANLGIMDNDNTGTGHFQ
ncbi:hypothetical protein E4U42_006393 [Claviceps africana]|uniref:Zn(2)-C6 fungal-type domain-containing protein n=1 Tax=Claviceps africana TaxID=83212 RepID=A0A8K0J4G7_9HYPO|nr:hypothetical protein E4U42_006393 [Claviceps africana]